MTFRSYFLALDADDRAAFADRVGSSVGYLLLVAYEHKRVELGFADVLVAAGGGAFDLSQLPLTKRAVEQHDRRNGVWFSARPAIDVAAPDLEAT